MAITVNGNILRNMPEQISKNTDDILELQEVSNNHGTRITALEQGAIALATFQDCTFTGTTAIQGDLVQTVGDASFGNNVSIGGSLSVSGSSSLAGLTASSGTFSGNVAVGGSLTVGGIPANVKPIYCHPLRIVCNSAQLRFRMTCLIFNNYPTQFTLATFKQFLNDLDAATNHSGSVMISGAHYDGAKLTILSYILFNGTDYNIVGLDISGNNSFISNADFDVLFPVDTYIYDGVNKIN